MNIFRLFLVLVFLTISVSFCFAQNVVLTTQAEVDAFDPSVTEITGFLRIDGANSLDPITDLSNLSNLTSVGGSLTIEYNLRLTNLNGLSGIISDSEYLVIRKNPELTNVDGLSAVSSVTGYLLIEENVALINLDGLSAITSVGNYIRIEGNIALINLDGLSNLTSVGNYIRIEGNIALINLDGLSNLTSMGGFLTIHANTSLTNVDGLSAITSVDGYMEISSNAALTNLDGLSAITSVGGYMEISSNTSLTNVDGLSNLISVLGHLHIEGNTALTNVDGLSNLTSMGGFLTIHANTILTNVDGLSNLTSVHGHLNIEGNAALTNVDGLSNLTSMGGFLAIRANTLLTNVDGLSGLTTVESSIWMEGNAELTNVDGLSGLISVESSIWMDGNAELTNVDGFSGLISVPGQLHIKGNAALTNLDGLSAITSVGGDLWIVSNVALTNLDGLSSLTSVGGYMEISRNAMLTNCCGIQYLLSTPGALGGSFSISANSSECSSEFEIISSCSSTYIFNDINEDCARGSDEIGIWRIRAVADPGDFIFESSRSGGIDLEELPLGSYTMSIDTNSGLWRTDCPVTFDFDYTDPDNFPEIPPFGLTSTNPCNEPLVTIQMPFARPCFEEHRIYVEACNKPFATGAIEGAYVIVSLDSILIYQGAELSATIVDDYTYQFDLGDINPGQCVDFWIDAMVSCDAILGQSLCLQADLYPAIPCIFGRPAPVSIVRTSCSTSYDYSYIKVDGYCDGDSLHFEIENTGTGDMACYSPIRFYVDGELEDKDSTMLDAGSKEIIRKYADGRTWRMEVDQHPDHPEYSRPNATIELCGDPDNWTSGIVNTMYQDDASPVVDIFCTEVTGSYDPNDKTGYPLGITDHHYVLPNQQMEYRIRFQNTGTDTAFTVVIRDTLGLDFDIFSVESGVSSHDYDFKLYGPRVLEWTFNNILLVDSTTNEPGSHGFVTFQVRQNPDLENDTELNNSAGIYFDLNDPVITNVTSHVVHDQIQQSVLSATNDLIKQNNLFQLYPNPTSGNILIDFDKNYRKINVEIYSILGQRIAQYNYEHEDLIELNMDNSSGVYLIKVKTDSGYGQSFRVMVGE